MLPDIPTSLKGTRALVLDAPGPGRMRLAAALTSGGAFVEFVETAAAANSVLSELHPKSPRFDVVVAEATCGGRDLLDRVERPPLVLLDSFGTEAAWALDRSRGAAAVVARPITPAALLEQIANAMATAQAKRAISFGGFTSHDPRMAAVLDLAERVAASRSGLLIQGESGTGKTRLARAIHTASPRADAPFVELNCGALPDALLLSELFGHKKGAFTGADRDRIGKFEAADGGTLFLDEIASASPELQVKLLRVLECGRFERVGDNTTRSVDVRVIAACNAALEAEVEAGRFREDLFWRLDVVAIDLPPLRERPGDLVALAQTFQDRLAREHGRTLAPLDPLCQALLVAHDWPGNVRELENALERAVLLARGPRLAPTDFGERFQAALDVTSATPSNTQVPPELSALVASPPGPLREALDQAEAYLVRSALDATGGHRQRTAALLDINRSTLFNKMRQHGLASFPQHAPDRGPAGTQERA